MSHTIEPPRSPRTLRVLEITDYRDDILRIGLGKDGIGIRSRNGNKEGPVVRVEGDDLTALRDLILAVPGQEIEPTPAPSEYPKHHGTTLVDGDNDFWIFNGYDKSWSFCPSDTRLWRLLDPNRQITNLSHRGFNKGIDYIIRTYRLAPVGRTSAGPVPWQEGDIIQYLADRFVSTYVRGSDGVWMGVRVYTKDSSRGESSRVLSARPVDHHFDRLLAEPINSYVIVRRGGVLVDS